MEDLAVRIQRMMNDRHNALQHFAPEEQAYFVDLTIAKIAQLYGGYHHFWRTEDEKFVFQGWVSGLRNMTPYQIVKVLNYVLDGKHKFSPRPPRTPMEFLGLRRDVNTHNVPDAEQTKRYIETSQAPEANQRKDAGNAFANMRTMLAKSVKVNAE